jgi:hypothetical protein
MRKIKNKYVLESIFILAIIIFFPLGMGKGISQKTFIFVSNFLSGMVKPYDRYVTLDNKSKVLIPAKAEMLFNKKEKTITIFPKRKDYSRLESITVERNDVNNFHEKEEKRINQGLSTLVSQDPVGKRRGQLRLLIILPE